MEHDSLEDYLELSEKISKDAKKSKVMERSIQRQKECERKALGIVHLLLERSVPPDIFLKSIVYLTPSYYDDVVEERALLLLCGYPLCRKKISKPKNRYSICIKSKKVYDLNEYGNFCSIFCFNASNHIKCQILDSPLWLRDLDDVPKFTLLLKKESCAAGIDIKSKNQKKNQEFTTVSSFAELSLGEVDDINFSVPVIEAQLRPSLKKIGRSDLPTVMENETEDVKCMVDKSKEKVPDANSENVTTSNKLKTADLHKTGQQDLNTLNDKISSLKIKCSDNHNNLGEIRSKSQCSDSKLEKDSHSKDLKALTDKIKRKNKKSVIAIIDPLPIKTKTQNEVFNLQENKHENQNESLNSKSLIELKFSFKDSGSSIENSIKNIFKSWINLETLMFVHGENTIKKILDVNKLSEQFEELKVAQLEIDQQQKYVSICRRLCEQEILEEKIDSLLVENKMQLFPDYKQLKQESKEFTSKVSTFLGGHLHETDDKNFGTVEEKQAIEDTTFIPLDDLNSQNTLRHQILLRTLKNSVEFLLDYLQYDSTPVLGDLNDLIKSFKLNAENIVFKLIIGNYLSIICLEILAIRSAKLRMALQSKEFIELENLVFQQLPGKKEVLTNSLKLINDVDNFIETYVKSTDR